MPDTVQLGGGATLDLAEGRVTRADGTGDRLTETELRLVRYLVDRAGAPVGRDELEQAVWGFRPGVLSRTVFTTVGRVRQKIEPDPQAPVHLVTEPGRGYSWAGGRPVAPPPPRLPGEVAPLFGREPLLAAVLDLLGGDGPDARRLVSLTGPGGAGKTRVAVEVARRWPGRALFVPLEAIEAVDAAPAAIAAALGASLGGRADAWGELAERTEGDPLVVLDNAEHLPGLGEPLAAWLAACPRLRLLVTTRVRLGVRAESTVAVPPLTTPASGADLAESEAGALLLHHARRARPGWEPSDGDATHLAAFCREVGGSPLAIELAAAWLRVLEPEEIRAEVGAGSVLVALEQGFPDRHRSMGAALAASWRLLSDRSARALQDLSVCAGPVDRATALALAEADLPTLSQLVDASLLHRHRADAAASARFALHPLVRQDARARLAARGDAAAVRERHARWFLGRLRDVVRAADADEPAARRALEPDHEDILAAWHDRARAGDADAVGTFAWSLYRYLDLSNRFGELGEALREAAGTLEGTPVGRAVALLRAGAGLGWPGELPAPDALDAVPPELRAGALAHAAIAAQQRGRLDLGERLGDAALARVPDDRSLLACFARSVRGSARLWSGRVEEARADLTAAASVFASGRSYARPAVHLGELMLLSGEPAAARDQLVSALAACRACDDRAFAALALSRLAAALLATGADPEPVCVEAIEEGASSRLPRIWWAGAVEILGERWARDPARAELGVTLLAVAASAPAMGSQGTAAARLEAARAAVPDAVWRRGTAAPISDAALVDRVRRS